MQLENTSFVHELRLTNFLPRWLFFAQSPQSRSVSGEQVAACCSICLHSHWPDC